MVRTSGKRGGSQGAGGPEGDEARLLPSQAPGPAGSSEALSSLADPGDNGRQGEWEESRGEMGGEA